MNKAPFLQKLTHRLSECPPEFGLQPLVRQSGVVHVEAIVFDTLRALSDDASTLPSREDVAMFGHNATADENWLRAVLIACWLLHDEWFRARGEYSRAASQWLQNGLQEVAQIVEARDWTTDADRREEMARRCLQALGLVPQGESTQAAQDRLTTLDSIERRRVLQATQAAQKRAGEIREAMRKKAAEEAAAKYTRE